MVARVKFPVVNQRILFDGAGIFGPQARAEAFAGMARASIDEIDRQNDAAVGHDIKYLTFVDGHQTTNLREAKDTSVIVARWELGAGVVSYIWDLLRRAGPFKDGKYRKSARMYADGVEITDPDEAIGAREVLFLSIVPYARKIERGKGGYSPGHVYEAVAAMANARFSNVAKIKFTFAEPEGAAPELRKWAVESAYGVGPARKLKGRSVEAGLAHKQRQQTIKNLRNPAILIFLT